jgi:DNA-binding GntR family transcriptional regulator
LGLNAIPVYWHIEWGIVNSREPMASAPEGLHDNGNGVSPEPSGPFRLIPPPPAGPTSVGDAVYDQILEALQQGRLQPGERLHDGEFAAQLGVSRTPVREALLRLRELGVVEFAPARYTRVAVIDPIHTAQAVAAWVTVYAAIAALAAAVGMPPRALEEMSEAHARFRAASDPFEIQALAAANADFYDEPTRHCGNPVLVRLADSVVHVVRLGLLQLPGRLTPAPLYNAQAELLAALSNADPQAARRAVYRLAEIPLTHDFDEPREHLG